MVKSTTLGNLSTSLNTFEGSSSSSSSSTNSSPLSAINAAMHNASVLYNSLNHTSFLQRHLQHSKATTAILSSSPSSITTTITANITTNRTVPIGSRNDVSSTLKSLPISSNDVSSIDQDSSSLPKLNLSSITKQSKTKRKSSKSGSSSGGTKAKSEPSSPSDDSSSSSGSTAQSSGKRKSCNRWTKTENEMLIKAIEKYGEKKWNEIAKMVGTKNSDQCNQHWWRVLNPKICKKPWSEEEDLMLIEKVREFGESAWKSIADSFVGRTDIQCRHRWIMLRKYEQEGKGRPVSRTNITCNSNVTIPQKLKETLNEATSSVAVTTSASQLQSTKKTTSRKKRSTSNASSNGNNNSKQPECTGTPLSTFLCGEGDLLCNEDPFPMLNYQIVSPTQQQHMTPHQLLRTVKREDSFDRDAFEDAGHSDLIDESVYHFDQQEILLCEGTAIVPFECKLEVMQPLIVNDNAESFDPCPEEVDDFVRRDIELEEKLFNMQTNPDADIVNLSSITPSNNYLSRQTNMFDPAVISNSPSFALSGGNQKEFSAVFTEWDEFENSGFLTSGLF